MYADALTKALAVDKDPKAKYFDTLGANAYLFQVEDQTHSDFP
jgi:hypothetical protein